MSRVVIDTSVLVKWFHSEGESDVDAARALRDAHMAGSIDCYILDLALYELGNVLVRSLHWRAQAVADQLNDVIAICGAPLVMSPDWMSVAAGLATKHKLTFYDASWAAAAQGMQAPLVSADAALQRAGLAVAASAAARQLGFAP